MNSARLRVVQPRGSQQPARRSTRTVYFTSSEVKIDGLPDASIAGEVGYISSVAEFTPKPVQTEELRTSLVYEVRVLVKDPDDQLRLGMPATVRLVP